VSALELENGEKTLKPSPSNWTTSPEKFAALHFFISKCRREIKMLDFKQRVTIKQTYPRKKKKPFSLHDNATTL